MNPIQQAWLKILSPLSKLFNEKLAKRTGLLGKIGRFFIIGPREYGYHPINQAFAFANRRYLFVNAILLHRYSVIKGMTHQGYHMLRPMRTVSFWSPLFVFAGVLRLVFYNNANRAYQPDNLEYVMRKAGNKMQFPLNTLNQRTSQHFLEINTLYQAEMAKRYHKIHGKIIQDRSLQSEEIKKTKYADKSYHYEPMKYVYLG